MLNFANIFLAVALLYTLYQPITAFIEPSLVDLSPATIGQNLTPFFASILKDVARIVFSGDHEDANNTPLQNPFLTLYAVKIVETRVATVKIQVGSNQDAIASYARQLSEEEKKLSNEQLIDGRSRAVVIQQLMSDGNATADAVLSELLEEKRFSERFKAHSAFAKAMVRARSHDNAAINSIVLQSLTAQFLLERTMRIVDTLRFSLENVDTLSHLKNGKAAEQLLPKEELTMTKPTQVQGVSKPDPAMLVAVAEAIVSFMTKSIPRVHANGDESALKVAQVQRTLDALIRGICDETSASSFGGQCKWSPPSVSAADQTPSVVGQSQTTIPSPPKNVYLRLLMPENGARTFTALQFNEAYLQVSLNRIMLKTHNTEQMDWIADKLLRFVITIDQTIDRLDQILSGKRLPQTADKLARDVEIQISQHFRLPINPTEPQKKAAKMAATRALFGYGIAALNQYTAIEHKIRPNPRVQRGVRAVQAGYERAKMVEDAMKLRNRQRYLSSTGKWRFEANLKMDAFRLRDDIYVISKNE